MTAFITEVRHTNDDNEGNDTDFVEIAVAQISANGDDNASDYFLHEVLNRNEDKTFNVADGIPGTPFTFDGVTYNVYTFFNTSPSPNNITVNDNPENGIALTKNFVAGNPPAGETLQLFSLNSFTPNYTMRNNELPPFS